MREGVGWVGSGRVHSSYCRCRSSEVLLSLSLYLGRWREGGRAGWLAAGRLLLDWGTIRYCACGAAWCGAVCPLARSFDRSLVRSRTLERERGSNLLGENLELVLGPVRRAALNPIALREESGC